MYKTFFLSVFFLGAMVSVPGVFAEKGKQVQGLREYRRLYKENNGFKNPKNLSVIIPKTPKKLFSKKEIKELQKNRYAPPFSM